MQHNNLQSHTKRITITIPLYIYKKIDGLTSNKSHFISNILQSAIIKQTVQPDDMATFLALSNKATKKVSDKKFEKILHELHS